MEQVKRQRAKGHSYVFTTADGAPWDMNLFLKRKLKTLLAALKIQPGGLHAFRRFTATLSDKLNVPLKTRHERMGHGCAGSLTLDIYTYSDFADNLLAPGSFGCRD
jgi:integrase